LEKEMKYLILAINLLAAFSISAMNKPLGSVEFLSQLDMELTQMRIAPVLEDNVEVLTTIGKILSLAVYVGARDTEFFCVPHEGYDTNVLRFLGSELHHTRGNFVHETVVVRLLALQAGRTHLKLNFKCGLPGWEWDILGSTTFSVLVKE
jgi:hypothetical protein